MPFAFRDDYIIISAACGQSDSFGQYADSIAIAENMELDELLYHTYMRSAHFQRISSE